jgi:hypothetical protein
MITLSVIGFAVASCALVLSITLGRVVTELRRIADALERRPPND